MPAIVFAAGVTALFVSLMWFMWDRYAIGPVYWWWVAVALLLAGSAFAR